MSLNAYSTYLMLSALNSANQTGWGTQRIGQTFSSGGTSGEFRNVIQNVKERQSSSSSGLTAGTSMDRIFEEAARKYGVDVDLLKAIGKAESGFNASAVSSAGAIGVMQLMPATAESLGVTNPYDARQNIMGGAKYISQLLDKYDGNTRLALAAYNAGSGNVDKYGGIPPFEETQNYVKRVMEYAGDSISTGKTVTAENGTETVQSQTVQTGTAGFTTADSGLSVSTELFLSLLNIMRAEMELKMASMLTSASSDSSSSDSVWL